MKLWTKIGDWIHEKLQVKFKFSVCEVIFGLPLTEDPLFDVLNCIIMYVKHNINGRRNKNKSFLFIELLGLIIYLFIWGFTSLSTLYRSYHDG